MTPTARPWIVRYEAWLVALGGALALVAVPLWLGYLGISWDAVNHHFYLGWTAEHPRFDQDYLPAAYQTYQYPYLYWPVYKLAMAGVSGTTAGIVLALIHATAVPAVWLIARSCIPGEDLFAAAMRAAGVLLGFMSAAVLSMLETTSNDLMAAIPLLWAYALALRPLALPGASTLRNQAASGLMAGISVAFKLSNGFLALALPVMWVLASGSLRERVVRCLLAGLAVLAGFLLFYGYWGWELWSHFGNPMYPLYDRVFAPAREALGWHR
jgi:hypothetical protein